MAIRKDIEDIQDRLKSGRYANEQAIKQGIVLRLLGALGWPVHDTQCVFPEFPLEGTRVDYALCHPPGKPVVVVEVKQPHTESEGDRQLFQYAFHAGAQIALLTTGTDWSFYLPSGQGNYEERRFLLLNFFERTVEDIEQNLLRFVGFESVKSGDAFKRAQDEHASTAQKAASEKAVPVAWRRLLEEPDSLLVDLLTEKSEEISGYKPNREFVASFIPTQIRPTEITPATKPPLGPPPSPKTPPPTATAAPRRTPALFLQIWRYARNWEERDRIGAGTFAAAAQGRHYIFGSLRNPRSHKETTFHFA